MYTYIPSFWDFLPIQVTTAHQGQSVARQSLVQCNKPLERKLSIFAMFHWLHKSQVLTTLKGKALHKFLNPEGRNLEVSIIMTKTICHLCITSSGSTGNSWMLLYFSNKCMSEVLFNLIINN